MTEEPKQVSEFDKRMMDRALRAAKRGRPSPNPHVGAVVARDGELVSVGYHARCGQAHAEIMAIQRAGEKTLGATLYVTFEPCNHYGRTGPCSEAIIAAGFRRVVVGCRDPAPHVPGSIERLRKAGLEVVVGVEQERAERQVADFSKFMLQHMPYVTLKAAVTLDGRIATRTGDSQWITGLEARKEAHRIRSAHDAVMVGVGTVLADDPQLTVRHVRGVDPIRVILDSHLRTPQKSRLLSNESKAHTLIFHAEDAPTDRRRTLERTSVELIEIPKNGPKGLRLDSVMHRLSELGVVRLLCEGGAHLHGSLLDGGMADEAHIFVAPRIIGDLRAVPLAVGQGHVCIKDAWRLSHVRTKKLEDDVLISGDIVNARQ